MDKYFKKDQPIYFVFPIDGDCVNAYDGAALSGKIMLSVKVNAPADSEVYINGEKAEFSNGTYNIGLKITGYRNTLFAEDRTHGTSCKIAVYHFPEAVGKYRISSDDNILFLQDITKNKDVYKSIFENPYLAIYKKAHDLYGAKVHLNLFYEFEPNKHFSDESREYFNLSMMTDKFREEFRANSDWLKLAFHSRSEFPDAPYKHASPEDITRDCIDVCREIARFAGSECITSSTTVHWGEANKPCVRALRALGFRSLTGYFEKTSHGAPLVAYYAPGELIDHVGQRDFWYDTDEDMLFGRIDLVLNTLSYDHIMNEIKKIAEHPHRGGFVSIMIHEQYFYKDYTAYLKDFEARVLEPARFLYEKGYTGSHISDFTAERALRDNPLFLG